MTAPSMVLPTPSAAKSPALPVTDAEQKPALEIKPVDTNVSLELKVGPPVVVDPVQPALRTSRFRGMIPSDWHIVPASGENIDANNTRTGEVFAGTIEEFNKMLRG